MALSPPLRPPPTPSHNPPIPPRLLPPPFRSPPDSYPRTSDPPTPVPASRPPDSYPLPSTLRPTDSCPRPSDPPTPVEGPSGPTHPGRSPGPGRSILVGLAHDAHSDADRRMNSTHDTWRRSSSTHAVSSRDTVLQPAPGGRAPGGRVGPAPRPWSSVLKSRPGVPSRPGSGSVSGRWTEVSGPTSLPIDP